MPELNGISRGSFVRIREVKAIRIPAPRWTISDEWCTSPMDALFETGRDYRLNGLLNGPELRSDNTLYVFVEIHTDDDVIGLGGIGLGSEAMAQFVEHNLRPLIVGANPFDVELLWEKMFRATINIGRKGLALEAISGVDIALWDILGKVTAQPVYNLLGGRTRERIRAYASRLYPRADLESLAVEARSYVQQGFTAMKMRFGYGPQDGRQGMKKNFELVRTVREAIGEDIDLAADAYMGWDRHYASEMIARLEEFQLAWIEEPLIPEDLEGYAALRRKVKTPISGGEHEFTRWGFRQIIEQQAVDILQPDVNRVGGITEARKIWALASAHHMPVIPHAGNAHNLHLVMSHLNSPMAEAFPSQGPIDADTYFSRVLQGEPEPVDGYFELATTPGLGISLIPAAAQVA
jgi:L-rhamnonate dehydratase